MTKLPPSELPDQSEWPIVPPSLCVRYWITVGRVRETGFGPAMTPNSAQDPEKGSALPRNVSTRLRRRFLGASFRANNDAITAKCICKCCAQRPVLLMKLKIRRTFSTRLLRPHIWGARWSSRPAMPMPWHLPRLRTVPTRLLQPWLQPNSTVRTGTSPDMPTRLAHIFSIRIHSIFRYFHFLIKTIKKLHGSPKSTKWKC